jgi:RNA polymerase sigma-70 factor (ECF subfamily)
MGDAARFRTVFEATYATVRRYVNRRGVTGGWADDVVAETFVVVWRRLDDVPLDDPLPWVLAVARNTWLNHQRHERRYGAAVRRLAVPRPSPPPDEPGDLEDVRLLRRALAALDPLDQEILRLVAWEGLRPTQAAQVLGCSPVAARVRLHRARQRLGSELAKRSPGHGQDGSEDRLVREASDD